MTNPSTSQNGPYLFTPRTIGILSIFGGFPFGFALSIANLKRLGRTRTSQVLYGLWGLATLALVVLGLYVPIANLYLVVINLVSAACFYFLSRNFVAGHKPDEKSYLPDSGLAAVGLGFLSWVVWFLIFSALLAGSQYLIAAYSIQLP